MADNLQTLLQFRDRYRVKRDSCGDLFIPCRGDRGEILAWGPETLAAHMIDTAAPNRTANVIMRDCPSAKVHITGDSEVILLAPLSDAETFFKACGARTRRQMTAESRAELVERGRQFRILPGAGAISQPQTGTSEAFGEGEDV